MLKVCLCDCFLGSPPNPAPWIWAPAPSARTNYLHPSQISPFHKKSVTMLASEDSTGLGGEAGDGMEEKMTLHCTRLCLLYPLSPSQGAYWLRSVLPGGHSRSAHTMSCFQGLAFLDSHAVTRSRAPTRAHILPNSQTPSLSGTPVAFGSHTPGHTHRFPGKPGKAAALTHPAAPGPGLPLREQLGDRSTRCPPRRPHLLSLRAAGDRGVAPGRS